MDEVLDGVKVHRCPSAPRKKGAVNRFINYYSFVFRANQYLRKLEENFDVVFVNQLSPVMMAQPAMRWAKKHGKKMVLYCLDLWPESLLFGGIRAGSPIYRHFLRVSRKIYRGADAIAVSSHGFIDYFGRVLGMDESQIDYLPQYAEELFDQLPETAEKTPGVDFLFAGNIGTSQAAETIVQAAKLLQDDKNIRIHMVGGGISLEHCRKMAQDLSNITFYGRKPLEEMPGFYAMADAMLITLMKSQTLSSNFPGKIQSYMAAGKPIFGSIDGETPRLIREAGCGDCVPAEDPQALAELLRKAAARQKELPQLGRNARQYYEMNFRREIFLKHLENILQENC